MKRSILCLTVLLAGCAHFDTTQIDESYEKGQLVRRITTKASAGTFVESKSQLSNFKANQTDKTQAAVVGSLGQESNATNSLDSAAEFFGKVIKYSK